MAKLENIQKRITLPADLTRTQRQLIAERVLEQIRENTSKGIGSDGDKFPGYSDSYKDSLDFQIAGKGRTPNLRLTGDMIADLSLIEEGQGYIIIGYPKGHPDADKVEGNQIGTYGSDTPSSSKARPFIGIPDNQLELIIAEIRADTEGTSGEAVSNRVSVESVLRRFGIGGRNES